ncbi:MULTISPECIES: hypothetical protein [Pseudoalteromonas]|uniref:capsular polysaccharide export protein, LipB/KpsS family n=1 Tax=Pseudoalteromonas TaxID=53246 RepID=UPI001582A7D9|nr:MULTISPECIES: hypothetical protein [Pseudoalteromonas]MDI4652867.1 hypothetical protein [Pseudoalteromonas shioyasakiensis]NUJ39655.1 hypothetical protein [Pseudoalteromonas sp. 0303]
MLDVNKTKKLINKLIDKTNTRALADVTYHGIKNFREKEHFIFSNVWRYRFQKIYSSGLAKETLEVKKLSELYVSQRVKDFYSKKVPKGTEYDYFVHDSYKVLGENSGYEKLYLVGDNWQNEQEKPIALMVGFNDWKLGFSADYLPEYRTAFLPRKLMSSRAVKKLAKLTVKPSVIIVWGYTESSAITHYAKKNNLPIYRMEDGFIRSAKLGAQHSTPYSLILDKTGFYYNCNEPSDIENIYNTYDFKSNPNLILQARASLEVIKKLKLSKYNLPTTSKMELNKAFKDKKIVAVLGQVDGDASIKYGNPDAWSSEELVKLAAYENPDCEIIYRPHPEVYKGFQQSAFKSRKVEKYATISPPDISFIEFLESVEHVYTISSLSGFEAIIRGVKVTTVGAPFYSGWGVTDDRVNLERRKRSLTLEELFAGAYLLYPRYLADLDNSYEGLLSSATKIVSDKKLLEHQRRDIYSPESSNSEIQAINSLVGLESEKAILNLVRNAPLNKLVRVGCEHYNTSLILLVCNFLKFSGAIELYLTKVRNSVSLATFNNVLNVLHESTKDDLDLDLDLSEHYRWLFSKSGDFELAFDDIHFVEKEGLSNLLKKTKLNELNIDFINTLQESGKLKELTPVLHSYLVSTSNPLLIMLKLAETLELLSLFEDAYYIYNLIKDINVLSFNRKALAKCSDLIRISPKLKKSHDSEYLFELLALEQNLKPEKVLTTQKNLKAFSTECNFLGYFGIEHFYKGALLDNNLIEKRVVLLLEIGEYSKALLLIKKAILDKGVTEKLCILYALALSGQGNHTEALHILKDFLLKTPTLPVFKEVTRLSNQVGNFEEVNELLGLYESKGLILASTLKMPSLLGTGKIGEAYDCYLETPFRKKLLHLFDNYKAKEDLELASEDLIVISAYGPGDEIRFASLYKDIVNYFGAQNVRFTCEKRLHTILKRSFPEIDFIPVARVRDFDANNPITNYDKLPDSNLRAILDNNSLPIIESAKSTILLCDLISTFRRDYCDFNGEAIFRPKPELIEKYTKLLPKGKKLVGVNWRSSLTSFTRQIHYLSIQELAPLFELEDIIFVNLQYDECQAELEWVQKNHPNKLLNIEGIDQYNDFDSVAALMMSLDLVIAPCTSVLELAGALGVPAFGLGNSAEVSWRIKNENNTDVWFESITHIVSEPFGDKKSLVSNLSDELHNYFNLEGIKCLTTKQY